MDRRAFLAGAAALPLAGCIGQAELSYRLSVRMLADGKERAGESVVGFRYAGVEAPGSLNYSRRMKGEAVTVDLGGRYGQVFVLLHSKHLLDFGMFPSSVFPSDLSYEGDPHRGEGDRLNRIASQTRSVKLSRQDLPLFVCFRDMNARRSVKELDPSNLDAHYGSGVRLLEARVEITKDPITNNMSATAPELHAWAAANPTQSLAGTMFPDSSASDLAARLCGLDFVRTSMIGAGAAYLPPPGPDRESFLQRQKAAP